MSGLKKAQEKNEKNEKDNGHFDFIESSIFLFGGHYIQKYT